MARVESTYYRTK